MSEQAVTETDSQVAATTPQGTEAPANDLSQGAEPANGAAAAPEGFDEDLRKRLESIDLATLPVEFRQKLEQPFKAEFTQKTQAFAEERKKFEAERAAIFELARKAIADKQAPAGPTADDVKRQKLTELAAQGDPEAQNQLTQMEVERQLQPIRTQVALQTAAQTARAANPYVVEHWGEIIQTIQNDPVIAQLATANNYAAADRVMIALGLEHQARDLTSKLDLAGKENAALKAKLETYEKARVASLPSSTTRAGTTTGAPSAGDVRSIEEAASRAWAAVGGRPDDFR